MFGTKNGMGSNLDTNSKYIGCFSINPLNLFTILNLDLSELLPQLCLTNKKANIAPTVADSSEVTNPIAKPKNKPANIFNNGLIGIEKNTVDIYTNINIKTAFILCSKIKTLILLYDFETLSNDK